MVYNYLIVYQIILMLKFENNMLLYCKINIRVPGYYATLQMYLIYGTRLSVIIPNRDVFQRSREYCLKKHERENK